MNCKIIDGIKRCTGKSYNPFKMWGSWVGAGIGLISVWVMDSSVIPTNIRDAFFGLFGDTRFSDHMIFLGWRWILLIILGFLIGWGIHALIRRLRK